MRKVGDFWVPDIDLSHLRRWGKTRRKTIQRFQVEGGTKMGDLEEALALVEAGEVAVDGGANVGAYSRRLAEKFETVYAFEPAPDTYAALARNIEEWGLSSRIIPRQCALSNTRSGIELGLKPGQRSVSRRIIGAGSIPAIPLDELELSRLDFFKLDVEGFEYQALQGACETLLRCKPVILFEDKPDKLRDDGGAHDPHRLLQSLGARQVACVGSNRFDWVYRF